MLLSPFQSPSLLSYLDDGDIECGDVADVEFGMGVQFRLLLRTKREGRRHEFVLKRRLRYGAKKTRSIIVTERLRKVTSLEL